MVSEIVVSGMSGQFISRRKRLVRGQSTLNGIDFLEVSLDQKFIYLHFIHDLSGKKEGETEKKDQALTEKNVLFSGGERIRDVRAESAVRDEFDNTVLKIMVNKPGDFSIYRLRLVNSQQDLRCPQGFDPQNSEIEFSFKRGCPGWQAGILPEKLSSEVQIEPPIDYQAKDYASFMRLMLDRLSVVMPQWKERHPSDMMVALVELLAYAGDHLSYYQDAVAGEAYLETARKRHSIRRHARLLDYRIDEGCNSRLWVCFEASGAKDGAIRLAAGDRLLTKCDTNETVIPPGYLDRDNSIDRWKKLAFASGAVVFELMHDLYVRPAHNMILFYDWCEEEYILPKGATSAALRDNCEEGKRLCLQPGDVLIFEEEKSLEQSDVPDPKHRLAVRLTSVNQDIDPLSGQRIVHISWHTDDALPWDMPVRCRVNGQILQDIFSARGNVALADQGRTVHNRALVRQESSDPAIFRPRLSHKSITFSTGYDHSRAVDEPAASCLIQKSYEALPAVSLQGDGQHWTARPDLLSSGRLSAHFVAEIEEDGSAFLRFGDGIFGRIPSAGAVLLATYRVGGGKEGNVGPDSIVHLVPQVSINFPRPEGMEITNVRNPLPAQGGRDGEDTDQVRLYAPHVFKRNERGVTSEDYAKAALRYPGINGAVADLRWTGSWHTVFVAVDRRDGLPVDAKFKKSFREHIEQFRLAGHDIEIVGPSFVPLHIALTVHVRSNYLKEDVRLSLLKVFSRKILLDGRRGFFHPDNFSFGQPVFLSRIVDKAMEVAGVSWIDAGESEKHHFHRWGRPPQEEIVQGVIPIGRMEIARLDNDPNAPENGIIEFIMEGGL